MNGDLALLAHELTHCGQFQEWGALRYFAVGIVTRCGILLHRSGRCREQPLPLRHASRENHSTATGWNSRGRL